MQRIRILDYCSLNYSIMLTYLYEHRLTEYLKTASDEQLEIIMSYITCDDLIVDRYTIYSAILTEKEYRQNEIKIKEKKYSMMLTHLRNHDLTNYLKTVSEEDLESVMSYIESGCLIGDKYNIYSAIITELEYRKNEIKIEEEKKMIKKLMHKIKKA